MPVDKRESRLELTAVDKASATINQVKGSVDNLRSSVDTMKNALAAVGVVAGVGAMAGLYLDILKSNAALVDLAVQSGASVESLSRLQTIAKMGGNDFEGFAGQLGRMVKGLKSSNDEGQLASHALRFLGVEAKDANGVFRDTGEIAFDVAKALAKYADDGNKLGLVQDILQKGGERFIPLMRDMAKFGGEQASVTAEQARQAKEYEEQLNRANIALEESRRVLVNEYSPALTKLLEQLTEGTRLFGGFWAALYHVGVTVDPFEDLSRNIETVRGRLATIEKLRSFGVPTGNPDILRHQIQFLQFMQRQEALEGRTGPGMLDARDLAAHPALRPSSGYQSPDLHKNEQELRLFIRAQQQLEEELGKINELTKAEIVINRVSTGSWKDLTLEHKAALIALGGEYDDRKLQLEQQKQFVEGWTNEARVIDASRNVHKAQLESYRAEREELEFQATLLGKTPRQLELVNAERKVELDMRSRLAALPRDDEGEVLPGAGGAMSAIIEQADQQKKVVRALIADRQAAERDWLAGAKAGFAEYSEAATNAAQNTHDFVINSLAAMENAFVQWARTGKLESSALADAIIADFIRISTRENITGPLATYVAGLFGGGTAAASPTFGFAEGGIMTARGPLPLRSYDGGGIADSPQLAMFGEGSMNEAYVPLPNGRSIPVNMNGGGGGPSHTFNFSIDARGADRAGLARLEVMIRSVAGSVRYQAVDAVRRAAAARGRSAAF
jgi:lambda family phage tail tape measure protein